MKTTYGVPIESQYNKLSDRTIDDLEEGDIIVDAYGDERKILGKCGEVYFISNDNDFSHVFSGAWTLQELKKEHTLKPEAQEEETKELTMEEIAKLANVPVEKLRIKD